MVVSSISLRTTRQLVRAAEINMAQTSPIKYSKEENGGQPNMCSLSDLREENTLNHCLFYFSEENARRSGETAIGARNTQRG